MMTTNASSTPAWEQSKENSAPLQGGRSVSHFQVDSEEAERLRLEFERRIQSGEGDRLALWLQYIQFHKSHFPSAVQFSIYERCFQELYQDSSVHDQDSFIKISCLYADQTQEPSTTFQELYQIGIGRSSAIFWNAWAFVCEKQQNFALAEQIFERGIQSNAQPMQFLLMRQKRFLRRMSRHFLNAVQNGDTPTSPARGVLAQRPDESTDTRLPTNESRSAIPQTHQTFIDRSRQRQTSSHTSTNTSQPFQIFKDTGAESIFDVARKTETREPEAVRWKENRTKAERWNKPGMPKFASAVAPKATDFAIFVDEDCAADIQRDREARERAHRDINRQQPKGKNRPMWRNRLLQDSLKIERNFEEARMKYRAFQICPDVPDVNKFRDDESMCIDDDDESSILQSSVASSVRPPLSTRSSRLNNSSKLDTSTNSVEPTINTQLAWKEISIMFSSPAPNAQGTRPTSPLPQGSQPAPQAVSQPFAIFQDESPMETKPAAKPAAFAIFNDDEGGGDTASVPDELLFGDLASETANLSLTGNL